MSACEKISSSGGVARPSYFSSVVSSPPPHISPFVLTPGVLVCSLAYSISPTGKWKGNGSGQIETNKSNISYFVQQHNTDLPDCKNEKQNVSCLFAFMKQKFKTKNVQFQNIFILPLPPTEGNGISWGWRSIRPKILKKCKKLGK